MTQAFDRSREVVRGKLAIAFVRVPDPLDRLGEVLPQLSASRSRFRSVVRQREIELQVFAAQSLDRPALRPEYTP